MTAILEIDNLHFSYGEIKVLHGISLRVFEGEIVTMIGANGAGKTTTLRATSGLVRGIVEGQIRFMGKRIDGAKSHEIAGMGLAQCLEGRHVFGNLSVLENLQMGSYLRKDTTKIKTDLEDVLNLFPRLEERLHQQGKTLSGGEQQMLAVGRALMQDPKLIMMDEPSLGLAPLVIKDIFTTIETIRKRGIPVLLIEQNSNAALKVADRGYVLQTGEIVLEDRASALRENTAVKASYLGMEADEGADLNLDTGIN